MEHKQEGGGGGGGGKEKEKLVSNWNLTSG